MRLSQVQPNLFSQWLREAAIIPGSIPVPLQTLVKTFRAFTESKGLPLPVNRIGLGKLLSASFLRIQRRDQTGKFTQYYLINKELKGGSHE